MKFAVIAALFAMLSGCATAPAIDTTAKRIAAAATIETIATVTASLTDSGVLTSHQAETIADALQEAQDGLTLIENVRELNNETNTATLAKIESSVSSALAFLELFIADRSAPVANTRANYPSSLFISRQETGQRERA